MAKHSKEQLPGIAFEKGEHLVMVIHRSKLIPVGFWSGALFCSVLLIAASILVNGGNALIFNLDASSRSFFMLIILVVLGTVWIATLISTHVYSGNRLYVTNKRLIQNSVTSLFSSSTNVIDLIAVEDVSFKKSGLFEHLFSIGTLRMSTIGSETTYTFKHVDTPTDELETITHLVHIEKGDTAEAACPTGDPRRANPTSFKVAQPVAASPAPLSSASSNAPTASSTPSSFNPVFSDAYTDNPPSFDLKPPADINPTTNFPPQANQPTFDPQVFANQVPPITPPGNNFSTPFFDFQTPPPPPFPGMQPNIPPFEDSSSFDPSSSTFNPPNFQS